MCATDAVTLTSGTSFNINFISGAAVAETSAVVNAAYSAALLYATFFIGQAALTGFTLSAVNGIGTPVDVVSTGGALNFTEYVQAGDTIALNDTIKTLDSALTTLRTQAQNLGTNVAVLQTRLDFTEDYVNTLEIGAAKLTLADLNEEGANLLALQTRQQLGIQALAFAGQAEQSILALFR